MADEFDNIDTGGMPDPMMDDPLPILPESSFEPRAPKESSGAIKYWALLLILVGGPAPHSFSATSLCITSHGQYGLQDGGYAGEYLRLRIEDYEPKTFLDINKKEKVLVSPVRL